MQALADFLGYRKARITDTQKTTWGNYRELLEQFARGAEVDAAEADLIIDAAGKTEDDLQRDVQTLQQRIAWAAQLQAAKQADATMRAAQAELEDYRQQLADLHAKLAPAIDGAKERIRLAEMVQAQEAIARERLTGTVLDSDLLAKIDRLNDERRGLIEQRRHIEQRLKATGFDHLEMLLDQLNEKKAKTFRHDGVAHDDIAKRIHDTKSQLALAEGNAKSYKSQLAEIDAELERNSRDLDTTQAEMLVP